jgi:hypothetical protein
MLHEVDAVFAAASAFSVFMNGFRCTGVQARQHLAIILQLCDRAGALDGDALHGGERQLQQRAGQLVGRLA